MNNLKDILKILKHDAFVKNNWHAPMVCTYIKQNISILTTDTFRMQNSLVLEIL